LQRDKKDVDLARKAMKQEFCLKGNVKIEKGDIVVAYIEERKRGEL